MHDGIMLQLALYYDVKESNDVLSLLALRLSMADN
jgi:hypothetical protein